MHAGGLARDVPDLDFSVEGNFELVQQSPDLDRHEMLASGNPVAAVPAPTAGRAVHSALVARPSRVGIDFESVTAHVDVEHVASPPLMAAQFSASSWKPDSPGYCSPKAERGAAAPLPLASPVTACAWRCTRSFPCTCRSGAVSSWRRCTPSSLRDRRSRPSRQPPWSSLPGASLRQPRTRP